MTNHLEMGSERQDDVPSTFEEDRAGASGFTWMGDVSNSGPNSRAVTPEQQSVEPQYSASIVALLSTPTIMDELEQNSQVIEWICSLPSMLQLAQVLTTNPPMNIDDKALRAHHQAAFVAAALMDGCGRPRSCSPNSLLNTLPERLCKAFLQQTPNGDGPLERLWSFATESTEEEVESALAGYFARVARVILERHPYEVAQRLQRHGLAIRNGLLCRIQSEPLADLVLCIVRTSARPSANGLSVMPLNGLVGCLVGLLSDPLSCAEAIRPLLDGLLDEAQVPELRVDLFRQFTDPRLIECLLDLLLAPGGNCSPVIAGSVLTKALTCFLQGTAWISQLPLNPPSPASSVGSWGEREQREASDSHGDRPKACQQAHESGYDSESSGVSEDSECASSDLRRSVLERLTETVELTSTYIPGLAAWLRKSLDRPQFANLPSGALQAAGPVSKEILSLVTALLQSGRPKVFIAMQQADIISLCVELLFAFPWNNILHNAVVKLVGVAVAEHPADPVRLEMLLHFLRPYPEEDVVRTLRKSPDSFSSNNSNSSTATGATSRRRRYYPSLPQQLVTEIQAENEWRGLHTRSKCERVGYMGHLHVIGKMLYCCGHRVPAVRERLLTTEGWSDVVVPYIQRLEGIFAHDLGAPRTAMPPAPPVAPQAPTPPPSLPPSVPPTGPPPGSPSCRSLAIPPPPPRLAAVEDRQDRHRQAHSAERTNESSDGDDIHHDNNDDGDDDDDDDDSSLRNHSRIANFGNINDDPTSFDAGDCQSDHNDDDDDDDDDDNGPGRNSDEDTLQHLTALDALDVLCEKNGFELPVDTDLDTLEEQLGENTVESLAISADSLPPFLTSCCWSVDGDAHSQHHGEPERPLEGEAPEFHERSSVWVRHIEEDNEKGNEKEEEEEEEEEAKIGEDLIANGEGKPKERLSEEARPELEEESKVEEREVARTISAAKESEKQNDSQPMHPSKAETPTLDKLAAQSESELNSSLQEGHETQKEGGHSSSSSSSTPKEPQNDQQQEEPQCECGSPPSSPSSSSCSSPSLSSPKSSSASTQQASADLLPTLLEASVIRAASHSDSPRSKWHPKSSADHGYPSEELDQDPPRAIGRGPAPSDDEKGEHLQADDAL